MSSATEILKNACNYEIVVNKGKNFDEGLRYNRKVFGSVPSGAFEICFYLMFLTEIISGEFSWAVKAAAE